MPRKSKMLQVYESLCPNDPIADDDPRRADIIREMLTVRQAKTIQDATKVVDWWDWDSCQQMYAWLRKARKMLNKGK